MAGESIGAIASADTRSQALGLDIQSLLKIILTQLTYQDPLKPMDNFEFVSQLAQFTTLEQTRQQTERIETLLSVQASTQAISLLGKKVDVTVNSSTLTGTVSAVAFNRNQQELTLQTPDGQVVPNILLSQITQVR
ncbi:flagellar hook capping FlgD N-terminal domain-containing protein [Cupriavidus basilensis]|uniref:Basal-body rod modification protein FlgD n=1 Tax=Cupriavidus basilensis TaxID=68895 RepID=A0ABT6AW72_9BURK|nr:flagellar hook capping FlgD N-terminal domain-containing protein [Cupriavidus basilensis]MDF3836823.1 flagellar hook capping FlgD N-terminal domain-containing protein [Cupriavidus basilensis]